MNVTPDKKTQGAYLGALGSLINKVGNKMGNRLPDLKISENLERIGGMWNPKPVYASDNRTVNSSLDPRGMSISGSQYPLAGLTKDNSGNKTSGNTGGGNTGGGSDNNLTNDANSAFERKKSSIMSRLQMMKDEAQRLRNEAKGQYDFTTGKVKESYGKLKELSKEKLKSALDALTQEDVGVQSMYGRMGGNTRRAMESAITRNRMLHRALGSLGSSFYTGDQSNTTNQGMNSVNDLINEEADKRSAIKRAGSETNTSFAQNDVAITQEEAELLNTALNNYNNANSNANLLEKNYTIDSEEGLDEADYTLNSALSNIKNYLADNSVSTNAVNNSTNGVGANYVKTFNPTSTIQNTLKNQEAIDSAKAFANGAMSISPSAMQTNQTPSSNSSLLSLLNPNKKFKKKEDTTGYFIG